MKSEFALSNVISIARAQTGRAQFERLYERAIATIEDASAYLNGIGRTDARTLAVAERAAYASESMRLSNRLIQLSAWLTLAHAYYSGKVGMDAARAKRSKIDLSIFTRPGHNPQFDALPERLKQLTIQSLSIRDQIAALDKALFDAPPYSDRPNTRAAG